MGTNAYKFQDASPGCNESGSNPTPDEPLSPAEAMTIGERDK